MAENLYQDKSVDHIKEDVKNKFKDIEKGKWLPERDDQEIYSAAIDTINAYIQEIKATKEVYEPWALKEFSDLKKEFANTHNTLKGNRICTKNENKALINDVANKIDNAEKVVLERLARNRKHKEISNANKKLEKQEGKSFFIFDKNTDQYIFTAESNKPTIHTVLWKFFREDTNIYTIDYSQCKNQRIKNKMIDLLGGISKCLIKYNKRSWTYNLINNWKILPERALIWEGVSLKTAESNMVEAQAKIRKNNDTGPIYKRSQFERSPKYNQLKDLIPVKLKKRIPEEDLWKFISETEKRLDSIIKEQKKLGWELEQDEPISKRGRNQMESHFINTSGASKDIIIWEDNSVIGQPLYDILSDERDAYKTYLTARIKTKRGEADHLTKRRQVFSGANEKSPEADPQSREHFSYGLSMFSKLVNKLEDTHGTSQEVAALKVAIRNYQHSLEHGRPSQSDLNTAIADLQTLFINYKSNDWSFSRITDATAKEKIKSLLIWDKTTAQRMIRELGSSLNVLGNNSTTFLRDEIADNEGIGFENTDYNQAFKNITTQLDFQENESEENQKKKMQLIDQLYQNIDSAESVFSFLKSKGMLPKSADYKNEAIKEGCKKIQQALAEKQKQMNNLEYNEASFREKLEQEKLSLEARMDALSDEERIRYQTISVTLENPAILQESLENAKNMAVLSIKYGGIASLLRWSLAFAFAKNWGKMVGTNADIFNSSHGLNGFLNFSDETVVWMWELWQMLIEELAIAIVAIALGAVTGWAGAVAVYAWKAALTAAKAARIANKANKIRKSFSLIGKLKSAKKYRRIWRETQKLMHAKSAISSLKTGTRIANKLDKTGKVAKGLKYADKLNDARNTLKTINQANTYVKLNDLAKVWKITNYLAKGSHLVFEGVGFHLSSTVLRNAFHGNELSTGINPWWYSEWPNGEHISNFRGYVQSIAFLGLLKTIGQPLQSLTGAGIQKILGEKYAPSMLWKVFHNIGSVGGELGSLMLAEQGIHLISEWEFAPVTWESLIQSLGLILWLRAYGFGKMKISKFKMGKKWLDQMTVEEGEKKITTDGNGQVIASNTAEVPVGSDLLSSPKTSRGKRYMPRERVRYENAKPRTEAKIQELQAQNAKKHQDLLHKKAELEKRIQDLKQQRKTNWETLPQQTQSSIQDIYKILQKGNIITIKGLKYQFNGVKNWKAEFIIESNAKKSAESSGKKVSEKLEVNSLIELKETHFNLEPGNKTTNSWRNAKLQELLEKNQKAESLKDLNRKINNKNTEINQISQKIHNLETQPNNPAFNEYFSSNVHKLFGKTVVIDGVAYKAKRTLNEDGALNFMYQGKGNWPLGADFPISSMKQLFEKGAEVYGFDFGINPDGTVNNRARELTAREKETHAILQELKKGENNYLEKRSTTKNEYLNTYKNQLQQAKSELQALEAKKTLSEERQKQIHTRRDKWAELNKELRKIEAELERTNSEIKECERLETKYWEDLKSAVKDSEQINQKRTKEQDWELRQEAKELQENKPQSAENKSESGDAKPQATESKSHQEYEAKSREEKIKMLENRLTEIDKTINELTKEGVTTPELVWAKSQKQLFESELQKLKKWTQATESKSQSTAIKPEILNEAPKDANDLALKLEKAEWDTVSSYEGVKLNRATKSMMDAQIFLLGVGKWFHGIGKARKVPNIPKKVVSQIRTKLGEVKAKFGNQLSNYYQRVWAYCKEGMKIFDAPRLERWSQTLEDGTMLEGVFRKGKLVSGKMMKDGNTFEGRFDKKWRLHGKGKQIFSDWGIYEWEFQNGQLIKGKKIHKYGHIWEGTFNKNGELSGEGVFLERDGIVIRWEFKDGYLEGDGYKLHPDGLVLKGEFKNWKLKNGEILKRNEQTWEYEKTRDVKDGQYIELQKKANELPNNKAQNPFSHPELENSSAPVEKLEPFHTGKEIRESFSQGLEFEIVGSERGEKTFFKTEHVKRDNSKYITPAWWGDMNAPWRWYWEYAMKKMIEEAPSKKLSVESIQFLNFYDSTSHSKEKQGIYVEQFWENGKITTIVSLPRRFKTDARGWCYIQYRLGLDARIPASERLKITQELVNNIQKLTAKEYESKLGTSQLYIESQVSRELDKTFQSVLDQLYPQS